MISTSRKEFNDHDNQGLLNSKRLELFEETNNCGWLLRKEACRLGSSN